MGTGHVEERKVTFSPHPPEHDRELARTIMQAIDPLSRYSPPKAEHLALTILLAAYPDGLRTTEIQKALGLSIATTIDMIVRERDLGAVEILDVPGNGRATLVRLTPKSWQERRRARWNRTGK